MGKDASHSIVSEVSLYTDRHTNRVFDRNGETKWRRASGELDNSAHGVKAADQCDCRFSRAVGHYLVARRRLGQIATGQTVSSLQDIAVFLFRLYLIFGFNHNKDAQGLPADNSREQQALEETMGYEQIPYAQEKGLFSVWRATSGLETSMSFIYSLRGSQLQSVFLFANFVMFLTIFRCNQPKQSSITNLLRPTCIYTLSLRSYRYL